MRSDFIGQADAFLGLPEAVSRSQFLVPRLDRHQMEEAIVRPSRLQDAEQLVETEPALGRLARDIFLLLCDISPDGHITRRRPRVDEVCRVSGASVAELRSILKAFQDDDRNFLLPASDLPVSDDSTLDVSHESLIRRRVCHHTDARR